MVSLTHLDPLTYHSIIAVKSNSSLRSESHFLDPSKVGWVAQVGIQSGVVLVATPVALRHDASRYVAPPAIPSDQRSTRVSL
ncbi:hypothetical protein E2C01_074923 [Portunus trituberculatus]|uniref:Uncharacterized protein n=1 Tax=Portunus trituberculatus TaxID=210409 RepID=A0A5B7IDN5_PORTR|nr:hypothetical protein [Portunus trituberculatus]